MYDAIGAPLAAAGLTVETNYDRTRYDDYQFGITRATGAIAESGTVIIDDERTSRRLAALAPWVHVAVLERAGDPPDHFRGARRPWRQHKHHLVHRPLENRRRGRHPHRRRSWPGRANRAADLRQPFSGRKTLPPPQGAVKDRPGPAGSAWHTWNPPTMKRLHLTTALLLGALFTSTQAAETAKLRVMLLSGLNHHPWKETTPEIIATLEASGRFTVTEVVPPNPADQAASAAFHLDLAKTDVIVNNWTDFP